MLLANPQILGTTRASATTSSYVSSAPHESLDFSVRELYRVDDLLEWANRPLSWRVRGLLVEGTYTILGGAKKSLKTTLGSAELAYAIANGVNWLDAPGFEVESPCPVVVLLNEGLRPYVRTLERISQRHDTEGIGPVHVIEAQGAKWGDADTETLIRSAVEELDAGLLTYDAAYGFVDGDTEAGNLIAMGAQLGLVQQLGKELGVDILIVHHLKKNLGRGKPDLDDLAWSGWAEWADSWLLLKHVTPPDVAAGHYNIGVVAGSRQWGEFTYEITGEFGAQTPDSIGPTKPPIWTVKQVNSEQAENWGKNYKKSRGGHEGILSIVEHHPFELTRSQLEVAVGGGKNTREAIRQMLKTEALISRYLPRKEGGGTKKRHLVGLPGHEPPET